MPEEVHKSSKITAGIILDQTHALT